MFFISINFFFFFFFCTVKHWMILIANVPKMMLLVLNMLAKLSVAKHRKVVVLNQVKAIFFLFFFNLSFVV